MEVKMNEKVLRMRLYFRGKQVNYAASIGNKESLISNRMFLGSGANMFWQIIDPKFPKKHLFVTKQNNSFNVMLTKDMKVDVKKGNDQDLSLDDLKKGNLLSGNKLILSPETSGTIHLNNDYQVDYSFGVPYVASYTSQQGTIIRQYHRWEELTSEARFTRNFIIIAMIISFIGMAIFSRAYKPPVIDNSLAGRLKAIEKSQMATKVGTTFQDPEQGQNTVTQTEEVVEETDQKADFAAMSEGERSAAAAEMAQALLGFDVSETQDLVEVQGPAFAVTSETIVAAAAGGGGAGPGKGKGPKPKGGAGSGPGIGGGSGSLDNSAAVLSQIGAASLMTESELRGAGTAITDLSQLAGGGASITAGNVQVLSGQTAVSMIASFRARNIKVVSEEGPKEELSAQEKGKFEMIKRFVDIRKKQIVQLFDRERQVQNIYGVLNVTIEVDVNGTITEAGVEGSAGSVFTQDFMSKARKVILGWKFPMKLKESLGYGFSLMLRS